MSRIMEDYGGLWRIMEDYEDYWARLYGRSDKLTKSTRYS
ncbi:MAG: hypothetical protein KatS3mg029_0467 [Saprospiraceae bacterium]|nr:MAG: hypothetical protein KatS3mg029_0467 [Saprospiraceae bacterium]